MQSCTSVVLDFLQSKCLFAVERALRLELELAADGSLLQKEDGHFEARNLWTSQLEQLMGVLMPLRKEEGSVAVADLTPLSATPTQLDAADAAIAAGSYSAVAVRDKLAKQQPKKPKMFDLKLDPRTENEEGLRERRSGDHMNRVVFHDPPQMTPVTPNHTPTLPRLWVLQP